MFAALNIRVMIKTEKFNTELQKLAKSAKLMSHPARLAILKYLHDCKSCVSGDITDKIPLSRTTVSQHLQELKKAGLIQGEIEGVRINYCLNYSVLNKLKNELTGFLSEITIVECKDC